MPSVLSVLVAVAFACAFNSGAIADGRDHALANVLCANLSTKATDIIGTQTAGFIASYPAIASQTNTVPGDVLGHSQAAFVYDNALTAIALVACGDLSTARQLGNALSRASQSDRRFRDGRVRNAYRAGPVGKPPLLPGWWDNSSQKWLEDEAQDSTSTGNVAWAALALLTLYDATQDELYLGDAERLLKWIGENASGRLGYSGGVHGFDDNQKPLTWESTEHNVDVYAASIWAHRKTGKFEHASMAGRARHFVAKAFHDADRHFDLGTTPAGNRAAADMVALDVQLWPWMAISDAPAEWRDALHFAETHMGVGGGFDFNGDKDGVWVEGTAQAALAYRLVGNTSRSAELLDGLRSELTASGLLNATRGGQLTTGLSIDPTKTKADFFYFRRPHLGATAWAVLAATGWNPFSGQRVH